MFNVDPIEDVNAYNEMFPDHPTTLKKVIERREYFNQKINKFVDDFYDKLEELKNAGFEIEDYFWDTYVKKNIFRQRLIKDLSDGFWLDAEVYLLGSEIHKDTILLHMKFPDNKEKINKNDTKIGGLVYEWHSDDKALLDEKIMSLIELSSKYFKEFLVKYDNKTYSLNDKNLIVSDDNIKI